VNGRDIGESSDEELIGMIAAGDMAALRALYDRHFDWLTMRLARRCSDRNVVDEVVQDTFLAVWRGAKRFRGEGQVAAWIWGIGIRRLLDRFRRRQVLQIDYRPLPQPSAEELVLMGLEHGDLARILEALSPDLRAVLRATVLDGLSTREAAVLLGIPQGTVKTRLQRARRELREALA
jgi:RNA polymerase sigma-70 factor (ECF subfamily)